MKILVTKVKKDILCKILILGFGSLGMLTEDMH